MATYDHCARFGFHNEFTTLLKGVTKLEFPGASITVRIAEIQDRLPKPEPGQPQAFSPDDLVKASLIRSGGDPRIALTRIWFDLEQELFRPSELGLSPPTGASSTTSRRIDDLVEAKLLDEATAHNIREFLELAKEITNATRYYSEKELKRAVEVGARLITEVRRQIVGAELEHHFRKNILWYHAQRSKNLGEIRSAVAASAPDFEYDYDLYKETIDSFNHKEAARAAAGNLVQS